MHYVPTDLLRSFLSVHDSGSFTRAANRVGRTQSAVSLQIKRLEDMLGVRLFQRDTPDLQLTAEGRTLARYARRILALNEEVVAILKSPSVSGRVRLGAPHEYTASLLPDFLGRFAASHPNVMLEVTNDLSQNLLQRQRNGEFDLVVALHEQGALTGGKPIHSEPLVWFTSADHDCERQTPLPLVVASQPCIYRRRIVGALEQAGRTHRTAYVSSSYDAILAAIRAGLGVTAMARSTVPPDARVLGDRDGLAPLGQLDVRLHRAEGALAESAVDYLENYITDSFRSLRPAD